MAAAAPTALKRNSKAPRQPVPMLPLDERLDGCEEVTLAFTEKAAQMEARRWSWRVNGAASGAARWFVQRGR